MSADSYIQFISVLIIFIAVLAATYFITKYLAGYQKDKISSGNIEIIETGRISTNKYIQIVRIGDKYMAIAVGKDEITALGEVDRESLLIKDTAANGSVSFKEMLDKFKGEFKK